MDYLYVCNTGSDYISKINLKNFSEKKIKLNKTGEIIGPHGICNWKSEIIVANSYSNSISKIDLIEDVEKDNFYIGAHCNDVKVLKNYAYIVCGESNSLVIFDLINNKITQEVPCENMPHYIDISVDNELAIVTNMGSDNLSIIDCKTNEIIKTIKTGFYPTKAIISKNKKYIVVCESNMGMDYNGNINIISLNSGNSLSLIEVGKSPVDMCFDCNGNMCFVSNFLDGTISLIDLNEFEEVKKVYIGGMPRGILKHKRYLYIGDNYKNCLKKYDIYKSEKNIISIGKEPNGMMLV